MKTTLIRKLKIITGAGKNYMVRKCLYFFSFIFRKSLVVKFISIPDPVIFSGNYFTLYWEIKGCYKIVINESIVLPGNTTRVHFDSKHMPNLLKIRFYGYKEVIAKSIPVNIVHGELQRQLNVYCAPDQFKARLLNVQLRRFVIHKLKYVNVLVPVIPRFIANQIFPSLVATGPVLKINSFPDPIIQIDEYKPSLTTNT